MRSNIFWNQVSSVDLSPGSTACIDFDIGSNTIAGTSNAIFSPFTVPTLTNGFSNVGGVWETAGYRKTQSGEVLLKGMVTATIDNAPFTLPVGYRPLAQMRFQLNSQNGTAASATLYPTGVFLVYRGTDGTADLSAISFTAAQ